MSLGRKREWAGPSASPSDVADTGAAIEQEMKRLRLAYDYSGANALWTPPDDGDTVMEAVDGHGDDGHHGRGRRGDAGYAEANALLREMHFLRQLRKFQAARSVTERQQQQQHMPQAPDPRY